MQNFVILSSYSSTLGTCKMRNEIETKRNEINRNETKFTETKRIYFVSFRFGKFRFVSVNFVSIYFVSFRFDFVSHFTGTLLHLYFRNKNLICFNDPSINNTDEHFATTTKTRLKIR